MAAWPQTSLSGPHTDPLTFELRARLAEKGLNISKLDLELLIEKNPILMGKCSISKWAYKFDHDQLLSGLSHVS